MRHQIIFLLLLLLLLTSCNGPVLNSDPGATPASARRKTLKAGQEVPPFSLPDQKGYAVSSAELTGGRGSILLFVPPDESTATPASYNWVRNNRQVFTSRGIELLLVAPQAPEVNTAIAERETLTNRFLSDRGLREHLGLAPTGPWVFVIGSNGYIQMSQAGLPSGADVVFAADSLQYQKNDSIFTPF
jgi:peroxiredoxin